MDKNYFICAEKAASQYQLLVYYTNPLFIYMDHIKKVTYLKISEVPHCL